jgi:hypothetical protein
VISSLLFALTAFAGSQSAPAERADHTVEASEPLRFLTVNDPYTRAALQLPFALLAEVRAIDPDHLDPNARSEWESLRDGLGEHVALLTSLGVDLAVPAPDDFLYGRAQGLVDRATLSLSPNPVQLTEPLIDSILPVAAQMDPGTSALVELNSTRVEEATGIVRPCPRGPWSLLPGHPWTLGDRLGAHHEILGRVETRSEHTETRARIQAMLALLDRYEKSTHASVTAGRAPL